MARVQRAEPTFSGYAGAAVEIRRPGVVTLLAILNVIGGVIVTLAGASVLFLGATSKDRTDTAMVVVIAALYLALGLVQLAAGIGLWSLRSWGRQLQIALSCIGLIGFPCGTLISVLILVYMLKPGIKILFSERPAGELTPGESAELSRALQSSGATVAIVAIAVVLVSVAVIGIIAAIAIPSLLRARVSANESATIGHVRTIISAEAAYSSGNAGFVDRPECLKKPASCIPGSAAASPFLDESIVFDTPLSGYVLQFHAGPAAPPTAVSAGRVSPSSLQSYAVTAAPVTPMRTGVRFFCGDSSGVVCSANAPVDPGDSGTCPATCRPLQ